MTALDTNVVVRLLTGDDPRQARSAAALLRAGQSFLPKTVIVETEWVLRHSYGLTAETISRAFVKLLGYPPLVVEDREAVLQAITWHAAGMDFADALHLASSQSAEAFASFDRGLAKRVRAAQARPPVKLLR